MAFGNDSASLIAAITPAAQYQYLTFHNGTVYAIAGGNNAQYLVTINVMTGAATRIGSATTFGLTGGALRVARGLESNGTNLYLSMLFLGGSPNQSGLYTLDTTDGTATLVATTSPTGIGDLTWTGSIMYIFNSNVLSTIDITNGTITSVATISDGNIAFWDSQESQLYTTLGDEIFQADVISGDTELDAILTALSDSGTSYATQVGNQFYIIQSTSSAANLFSLARFVPTTVEIDTSGITTAGSTYQVPITFNNNVTLTNDDIVVEGANEGMLMGSGMMYMLPITVPNSLTNVSIVITILDTGGIDTEFVARASARANIQQNTATDLNSYFFTLPHNFDKQVIDGQMNTVTEVTDNNKLTFWQSTATLPTLNFQIHGSSMTTPNTVDTVYIVGQNIRDFDLTIGSDTLIDATTNETDGNLQYAMYTGLSAQSGTTATLEIVKQNSSQPVRIYQVMLMEQLWHFPDASFSVIDLNREKRGSIIQEALDYSTSATVPMLNYQKNILALEVSIMSISDTQKFNNLTDTLTNFTFCREWPRWPDQVYTCHFRDDMRSTYPSRRTSAGVRHNYVIQQQ